MVMELRGNILESLKRDQLVREGHFAFASGRHSGALFDRTHLTTDPVAVGHMSYGIAKRYFTDLVETVASPSIQGAGLALWVAHFLDPMARVVPAETHGEPAVPERLLDLVAGKRLLLVDDLIIDGNLMRSLLADVERRGGEVVGIAALWNVGEPEIGGHPVFGLLNTAREVWPAAECPLCREGDAATPISV